MTQFIAQIGRRLRLAMEYNRLTKKCTDQYQNFCQQKDDNESTK